MTERLQKLVHFITELEKLKLVERQNNILDSNRQENSAEHSWHAALIAVLMQEYAPPGVDVARVVKMLLIHDVVEIDAGDTYLYDDQKKKSVILDEGKAAIRLFGILPSPQGEEYLALWHEFEARITPDAKFAAAIDNLQPLLNYEVTGRATDNPSGPSKSQRAQKKRFIKDVSPQLWDLAEHLIASGVAKGLYKGD